MDDLISRQAAIDVIKDADVCVCYSENESVEIEDVIDLAIRATKRSVIASIEQMPSAQPKAGKWIKNGNKYTCPFCGTGFTTASEEVRTSHKYCYYCGVKMEGTE